MNKIAIIGAGWYGCHIASSLLAFGFEVKVFESESDVLTKASGNNQFRLHLGFHYCRHYETRTQSRDGYQRFIERYSTLSSEVGTNIYSVPKYDSALDFKTYKSIMMSSGIDFKEIDNPEWSQNMEGSLLCKERVIETRKARDYFKHKLRSTLLLDTPVEDILDMGSSIAVNGEEFDFVIDCTWGHFRKNRTDVFYEPTILLYYETAESFPAFTMVDGALCSIYPTENKGIYTLSSVAHTPFNSFGTSSKARSFLNTIRQKDINAKIEDFEKHITKYVPQFKDIFKYTSPQLSIKTKVIGAFDDRSCSVKRDNRYISVMSGKIDTIFHGMERVLHHIESYNE